MSAAQGTETEGKLTVTEMLGSLNGFDEIAINKAFDGRDVFDLLELTRITGGRALVFIDQRRKGLTDAQAKDHALGMTINAVDKYFAADPVEVDEDDPETPEGKESTPSE